MWTSLSVLLWFCIKYLYILPHIKIDKTSILTGYQILKGWSWNLKRRFTSHHLSHVMCFMSLVLCHVSHVMCHMSHVLFFFCLFLFCLQNGEGRWWRFYYQQGDPVSIHLKNIYFLIHLWRSMFWKSPEGFLFSVFQMPNAKCRSVISLCR